MNSYATLTRLTRGSLWMLAFVMFSTGWAQAAPFMYYPSNNPSAIGTSMAGTPTTFDASGTPGSPYRWRFRGCSASTCPTGKVVEWTYPDPGRTFVMLTVDGRTFPNTAIQVQQGAFAVTVVPHEGGMVSAGAGISEGLTCGPEDTRCQESYVNDVDVLLHAVPSPEWRTSHWRVNGRSVMTDAPLMLKGDGPFTAQAVFTLKHLQFTSTPPPLRGAYYDYEIRTSGGRGTPTFALLQGPPGMTVSEYHGDDATVTGLLEWHVTPEDSGTQTVRLHAHDEDGLTAEQTFALTVTNATFDRVAPAVTLSIDPDIAMRGESVVISSAATDNLGVMDFALIINGDKVATSPGTLTYAPPKTGRYRVVALEQDAGGNTEGSSAKWAQKPVFAKKPTLPVNTSI